MNLRAPYAPFVMAAVRAKLDPAVAQEVARHCLRKGVWSLPGKALLRQHGLLPVDEEMPEDVYRSDTLWEILARGLLYSECWQWGISKTKHINILLLQVHTLEEKHIANSRPSCRFWAGMGSQVGHTVGLGAIVKGRAASGSFSAVPQQPMQDAIAGDVTVAQCTATLFPIGLMSLRVMHVLLLLLDLALSGWFEDLQQGDFAAFDAWMEATGAPTGEVLLPYADICGSQELDLRPAKKVRPPAKKVSPSAVGTNVLSTSPLPPVRRCKLSAEAVEFLVKLPTQPILLQRRRVQFFGAWWTGPLQWEVWCGEDDDEVYGAPFAITFEWAENLLDEKLRAKITAMIRARCFLTMEAAPICSGFSVAVTPPVQSSRYPRHTRAAAFNATESFRWEFSQRFLHDAVAESECKSLAYFVENPDLSWFWLQKKWRRWRASASKELFKCSFCHFGIALA